MDKKLLSFWLSLALAVISCGIAVGSMQQRVNAMEQRLTTIDAEGPRANHAIETKLDVVVERIENLRSEVARLRQDLQQHDMQAGKKGRP